MPKKKTVKAHCRDGCRMDWHKPTRIRPLLASLAMIVTLGAVCWFRPYRFTCYESVRYGTSS